MRVFIMRFPLALKPQDARSSYAFPRLRLLGMVSPFKQCAAGRRIVEAKARQGGRATKLRRGHDVALFLFIVKNTFISGGEQFHHRIYHLINCAAFGGAAIGSVVNHAIPAKWGNC